MTAIQSQPHLTFEQFLDYDDGTARRFELFDGIPVPMPEPSDLHEDIINALKQSFVAARFLRRTAVATPPSGTARV